MGKRQLDDNEYSIVNRKLIDDSPTTRLGDVHLTVASLDRQIEFYTQVLNLKLYWLKASGAALGTEAEVLLRLTEDPRARRVQNTTGLYHFAILYPSRTELARHCRAIGATLSGFAYRPRRFHDNVSG